jgi:hypothetical protein
LQAARKARRIATVRLVEFAPFPRERRDEQWGVGFTLDLSSQGACLRTKEAAAVGSLLRVVVRGVDGRPTLDSIARVVWHARGSFGEVGWASRCSPRARAAPCELASRPRPPERRDRGRVLVPPKPGARFPPCSASA